MLLVRPTMPKIQRAKKSNGRPMKGRPITAEEFERMLGAVSGEVGEEAAVQWQHYLQGLWASGLRLGESLDLWWDREDRLFPVFPRDGRPMLRVPGELEKGHTDRLVPIAPEFALMLVQVPEAQRVGPVFKLDGRVGRLAANEVSKTISRIGKAAGSESSRASHTMPITVATTITRKIMVVGDTGGGTGSVTLGTAWLMRWSRVRGSIAGWPPPIVQRSSHRGAPPA